MPSPSTAPVSSSGIPTGGGVLVGIDAGGSYVKATAFDLDAGTYVTAAQPLKVQHPGPGRNERDADVLWSATAAVVRQVVARVTGGGDRVLTVGVTAHGNGLYLVDRGGHPTRPAIQASDTRASALVRLWEAAGVPDELRATIWNGVWPGQPGPLLAWLAEHEPETLTRSVAALMCGDYLRVRLTGQIHAEATAASCNGLVDPAACAYSDVALAGYGITGLRRLLPVIVPSTEFSGAVTAVASELTGIPVGTPVVAGVVDNVGLQLGAVVVDGSQIVVGAGTWSINQLLVERDRMTLDGPLGRVRPYAACLAVPAPMAMLIEASATSASTLGWAVENVPRGVTAQARAVGADVFTHALAEAAARPRRVDAPMFLPYLDGSRDEPGARGAWLGLSSWCDEVDLLAATVEGVCLEHRRHVERLSLGTDGPQRLPLRLAGGASRSDLWAQEFADTSGRRVEVSDVVELGAVGAAAVAGTAAGVFSDLATGAAHLNPTQRAFTPSPEAVAFFDLRYERYLRCATALEQQPWMTTVRGDDQ